MPPRRPVVELLDPLVAEILRKKTPAERLQLAADMWNFAVTMVRGTLRQQHPDWTDDQIQRESANRLSHGATERARRELAAQ